MLTAKTSVSIKKPVADVFKFVATDYFINHPKLDPRTVSTQLDKPGPIAVGVKGKEVRKEGGRKVTYAFEVTDYQMNKQMGMKAKGGPADFAAVYAVKSVRVLR